MVSGRWIEYGAWLAGAALLTSFGGARLWAEHERQRGLAAFRAAAQGSVEAEAGRVAFQISQKSDISGTAQSAGAAAESAPGVDQSLWSGKRARAYAEAVARPGAPVGALRIPSIRLEVPVYSGATELNLNRGAAHIEDTSLLGSDGNVGIAAHRDGFFRALESLRIDAEVILEVEAQTLHYRVVDISIVKPTDVHVLAPTATPSVTLVTCYPFYYVGNAPERYIVRAELVSSSGGGLAISGRQASVRQPRTRGAEP